MYNLEKNYLFIAVPRTASGGVSEIVGGGGHETAKNYRRKMKGMEGYQGWDKIFKFAFSRNPYDRFLSAYYHLGMHHSHGEINQYLKHMGTRDCMSEQHNLFRPQTDFVCIDGKIAIDFLGSFERLTVDWLFIQNKLGIEMELPHINSSIANKQELNQESKEILFDTYKEDFKLLEYTGE